MESGRRPCRHRLAAAIEAAASDGGARMLRIAENVFVIEHDDATDEWPHGNTGVIVGRTGLFVIDSGDLPSRARGAQYGPLDRAQPGILEGAVHSGGLPAARRARRTRARDRGEAPCGAR
jgi:hypothetical protein